MSALHRGLIAVLCLALATPAQAQQRYQLAPLGFSLDGVDVDQLPRPSRQQWRAVLSAMFPPSGKEHRPLQRDMLVGGHGRRQDVTGALVRPNVPTFAVECSGPVPNEGGGTGYTGGVAAVATNADGLAPAYTAHGPRAGARDIDRFQALVATMRSDAAGGRQALRADHQAAVAHRFGAALEAYSTSVFAAIEPDQWERAGPMNTRLCDGKWGEIPHAVTCLRVFPAGETPDALLSRHLLADTWECDARIVRRGGTAEQATAQVRCDNATRVGGIATRHHSARRDPADGRLVFAATYGTADDARLRAAHEAAAGVIAQVLARR